MSETSWQFEPVLSAKERARSDALARERARTVVLAAYTRALQSRERAPQAFEEALTAYLRRHPYVPETTARHTVAEMLARTIEPGIVG